jgi:hypothetical protein
MKMLMTISQAHGMQIFCLIVYDNGANKNNKRVIASKEASNNSV